MKATFLCLAFLLSSVFSSAQETQEAHKYLQDLSQGQKNISEQLMRYISASAHSMNTQTIERKREDLIEATRQVKTNVEQANDFQGDSSLRNAMLEYFDLSLKTLTSNYKSIALMKDEAESDYEVMKAMIELEEEANKELDAAQKQVEEKMERFADSYNINLISESNPLSEMIAKSNDVSKYYNQVFLPVFKVNLQSVKLKEAIQKKDIEAIEKERKLTETYAEEARETLEKLPAYNGDGTLKEAGLVRLNYYLEEANIMGLTTVEFEKLSKKLQSQKKTLGELKPKERTKKMIDEYNRLVDQTNQLSSELNQRANQFNMLSHRAMQEWQQIVQAFRRRHIPKYGLYEQQA